MRISPKIIYFIDIISFIQSPNIERSNLGLVKSFVFRESKTQNKNYRFDIEYRLFRMFGLEASYDRSSVTVKNVLHRDLNRNLRRTDFAIEKVWSVGLGVYF